MKFHRLFETLLFASLLGFMASGRLLAITSAASMSQPSATHFTGNNANTWSGTLLKNLLQGENGGSNCDPLHQDCVTLCKCDPGDVSCLTKCQEQHQGHTDVSSANLDWDWFVADYHLDLGNGLITDASVIPGKDVKDSDFWTALFSKLFWSKSIYAIEEIDGGKKAEEGKKLALPPHPGSRGPSAAATAPTHRVYQQYFQTAGQGQKLPIIGAQYVLRMEGDFVQYAVGRLMAVPKDFDATPTMTQDAAVQCAQQMKPKNAPTNVELAVSSSNYSLKSKDAKLVWRVEYNNEEDPFAVELDAKNASQCSTVNTSLQSYHILGTISVLNGASTVVVGGGLGIIVALSGDNDWSQGIPFCPDDGDAYDFVTTKQVIGSHLLSAKIGDKGPAAPDPGAKSPSLPAPIETDDCTSTASSATGICSRVSFTTKNNVFGDDDDKDKNLLRVAAGVQRGMESSAIWFYKNFHLAGFDGSDHRITAKINHLDKPDASSSPQKYLLSFDDGSTSKTRACLADVGHEYAHSVMWYGMPSPPVTNGQSEMDAINEGLPDIFGVLIRSYAKQSPDIDWNYGKEFDLSHPEGSGYAGTYKGYYYVSQEGCPSGTSFCVHLPAGGITPCANTKSDCDLPHLNGTVLGKWFALLAKDAGTVTESVNDLPLGETDISKKNKYKVMGIGLADAQTLVFNTMTSLPAAGTFRNFCLQAVDASHTLSGHTVDELNTISKSVFDACYAVGILQKYDLRYYLPRSGNQGVHPWPATFFAEKLPTDNGNLVLQAATDDAFKQGVVDATDCIAAQMDSGQNACSFDANLKANTTYYWHVRPANETEWGATQQLTTSSPTPELVYPNDGGIVNYDGKETSLGLSWKAVTGATGYVVHTYAKKVGENAPETDDQGAPVEGDGPYTVNLPYDPSNPEVTYDLPNGRSHPHGRCWSVEAVGPDNDKGGTSDISCYSVQWPKPVNLKPSGDMAYSSSPVTYTWEAPTSPEIKFHLAFFANNQGSPGAPADDSSSYYVDATSFQGNVVNQPLCWKVQAEFAADQTVLSESDVACVNVTDTKPVIQTPTAGQQFSVTKLDDFKTIPISWTGNSSKGYLILITSYNNGNCPFPVKGQDTFRQNHCPSTPPIAGNNDTVWDIGNFLQEGNNAIAVANITSGCVPGCDITDPNCNCVLGEVSDPVTFSYKWTAVCGDGIKGPGEACDDGGANGQPNHCNSTCSGATAAVCGNGVIEAGEQCDDGNQVDGDGCSSSCQTEIKCGNGKVESGEQCDDGVKNGTPGDTCSATCKNLLCDQIKNAPSISCPGTPSPYYGVTPNLCTSPVQFGVEQYPGDQSKIEYVIQICQSDSSGNVSSACNQYNYPYSAFGTGTPIDQPSNYSWAWRAQVVIQGCPSPSPFSGWLYFICDPSWPHCPNNQ